MNPSPETAASPQVSFGWGDPVPQPLASRRHTVRFLVLVGGIAAAGLLNGRSPVPAAGSRLPLYCSIVLLQLLFAWFVRAGVRAQGGRLSGLVGKHWHGVRDVVRDLMLALLFVPVLHFVSTCLQQLLGQPVANTAFLLPVGPAESLLWTAVSVTAGAGEELAYRGYLQRQLWALTGSLPRALGWQALIFALGHAYQGWQAALVTGVYGLAFGLLAAWRKSILPGAAAHALVDIVGGLVR